MKDDRKRVAVDDPYVAALGLTTYCFAICEWNAVWSAEKLKLSEKSSDLCLLQGS